MNNIPQKLRLIYWPFLVTAVAFVTGYTLLNWLLFIKFKVFPVNEEIVNIWTPLILSLLCLWICMQRRINLLSLAGRSNGLFSMMAALAVGVPTLIAQLYLETASGKLTPLTNVNEIAQLPPTKYYTIKTFYIDKLHSGAEAVFTISGKHSEYLNMDLFFVSPILATAADTAKGTCLAWMGVKYHQQIDNKISEDAKKELYKAFADGSEANFDARDLARFSYLDRIGNTDDHKGYRSAIKRTEAFAGSPDLVLIPVDGSFESRNGDKFAWIFGSFGIGAAVWFLLILIPGLNEGNVKNFLRGKEEKSDDFKDALTLFLPREGYFITPIIVDLNILTFLIMFFSGLGFISFDSESLLAWGANYKPAVAAGQWWRPLTSIFLHAGFIHVFANMIGLIFAGLFLEPKLGRSRFAIVYLATGVIASLTSLWWHNAIVSVGASGAIFGLYGALLALILTKVYTKDFGKAFLPSILIFVGYNLVMGLQGSIDNAAHIGGLVSGFVIGLILSRGLKTEGEAVGA